MKANKPPVLTHHWSIGGTIPNQDQRYQNYGQNVNVGVEAASMTEALTAALKLYPDLTIFHCNHRGEIHVRQVPSA